MIISLIFAMNAARIIGNNGELPWHLPSDLKRFKELTTGHPVIMGRKTFESILDRNGKPLPNRCNVVITHNLASSKKVRKSMPETFRNCVFVSSLLEGIRLMEPEPEVFIIGGAEIYTQALEIADRMYFTQVGGNFEGDVKFPLFNMNDWETVHDELVTTDSHPYAFSIMERTGRRQRSSSTVTGDNLVNPMFAKRGDYDKTIDEIIESGVCPFCPETFLWHPWPILHRLGDWFITRSGWPYKNTEHHFLIIGERHITSTIQMTMCDNGAVRLLTLWAVNTFNLKGWGSVARSGDTDYTGATVQHLHFHLIQPKLGPDGKALTVLFPIG
jgi:dihydrofolate reductase/diadenosine tetraphosphate (Ap4A) HIT family hydrolase